MAQPNLLSACISTAILLLALTVDRASFEWFGAGLYAQLGRAWLNTANIASQPRSAEIPLTLGGVAIAANVQGVPPGAVRLSGSVIADIYLGNVRRWNDAAIQGLNHYALYTLLRSLSGIDVRHAMAGAGASTPRPVHVLDRQHQLLPRTTSRITSRNSAA